MVALLALLWPRTSYVDALASGSVEPVLRAERHQWRSRPPVWAHEVSFAALVPRASAQAPEVLLAPLRPDAEANPVFQSAPTSGRITASSLLAGPSEAAVSTAAMPLFAAEMPGNRLARPACRPSRPLYRERTRRTAVPRHCRKPATARRTRNQLRPRASPRRALIARCAWVPRPAGRKNRRRFYMSPRTPPLRNECLVMINGGLTDAAGDRSGCNSLLPRLPRYCCTKSSVGPDLQSPPWNSFDCATRQSFCPSRGQRIVAMIETVTALLGLVSAGIFLAHAFEGFRSRA